MGNGWATPLRLLALVLGAVLTSGCASLIPLALNPSGVANQALADTIDSMTSLDTTAMSGSMTSDIDRILRDHPEAGQTTHLQDIKEDLKTNGQAPKTADNPVAEYAAQFDRRSTVPWFRSTNDHLNLDTTAPLFRPYGLRKTDLSHPSNDDLPPARINPPMLSTEEIRFGSSR